jgi:hypothetical protein
MCHSPTKVFRKAVLGSARYGWKLGRISQILPAVNKMPVKNLINKKFLHYFKI